LKALGWAAFGLAIPVIGFGGFFFLALIDERGRWAPGLSEGILVPLTWVGAVLLPLAGRKLLRAAASKAAPHESGWRHSSLWPRFIAASLLSMVAVGVALMIAYLGMRRSHLEREAALRARAEAELAENRTRQSKREQFVPREGMADQTSWSVHPRPSFLNSNGWAVMARMTIGGVARIQLPGEAGRRCDITLLKGDDAGITVRIDDLVRNSAMTLSLRRDQPGEITLDGAGYRVLFPTTQVAASEPGISHFAHVIVTEAGEQKELSLSVDLPGEHVRDALATIESARPTVDSVTPVVVQTEPASGARDVTPGPTEIRVRFSKRMDTASWSWVAAWINSIPKIIEGPRYEADNRTCVLKVDLDPGRTYAYWLNSSSHQNFKDPGARPAVPYLLIFRTRPAENSFDGSDPKPAAREPSIPNTP
jgi:RNA polymerase sigma-70 factor (ECF subfamily)